ncbi:MAG: type II secretion system GspH family protein [Desulfohalobiaceae bacterium]|nr:type II secretion system GspH family protein [Desulfohalobiaceae bacterium]
MNRERGFTLVEMLVAVIIVGSTLAVFFQLLSSSLRLEKRGRDQFKTLLAAKEKYMDISSLNIKDREFPWQGADGDARWTVRLERSGCSPKKELGEALASRPYSNLYKISLDFVCKGHEKVTLTRYIRFPGEYFSEEFQNQHIKDEAECLFKTREVQEEAT